MCECVLYRLLRHIALNALHALIFVLTVSTNNIQSNHNVDSNTKTSN